MGLKQPLHRPYDCDDKQGAGDRSKNDSQEIESGNDRDCGDHAKGDGNGSIFNHEHPSRRLKPLIWPLSLFLYIFPSFTIIRKFLSGSATKRKRVTVDEQEIGKATHLYDLEPAEWELRRKTSLTSFPRDGHRTHPPSMKNQLPLRLVQRG
ncbi:hypothetical protein [Rhizobium sp. BK418]|uniref:hypothetical protein n=1 Tax=Rhizobium sp. BK418 TaxID=2512120 RepID=UPI001FDFE318|nr:hypothetical protein [Rhizobium sp. BK418]